GARVAALAGRLAHPRADRPGHRAGPRDRRGPMPTPAAAAAPFGRDLDACFARIERLLAEARARGVHLLALPEAALGGYLADLGEHGVHRVLPRHAQPPPLDLDGPEIARLARMAGDVVVTAGFCESDGAARYNTVVADTGDGELGEHPNVHQPLGESERDAERDPLRASA